MADAQLTITETEKNGILVIALSGELDAHTVTQLKGTIDKAIASGKIKIMFDFTALSYISSAGIGVLNAALASVKAKSGKITIGGVSKTVMDTLDVMYFTKKVDVFPSPADALAGF